MRSIAAAMRVAGASDAAVRRAWEDSAVLYEFSIVAIRTLGQAVAVYAKPTFIVVPCSPGEDL